MSARGETMKRGQIWRTPGPLGEEIIEILAPSFNWNGQEWVPAKKIGSLRPTMERVDWIRAGGKRDPVLERVRPSR